MERLPRSPGVRSASADNRDRELVRRYQDDVTVRPDVVEAFMFLPNMFARRYHRGEEPLDDLRQVAVLGLLKALRGFDPDHGASFTAYAVPTITGELRRHFRDKGWSVRVPRSLQELALSVMKADERLSGLHGRRPTAAQVAEELGRSVEDVLEAREAATAIHASSLDRPAREDEGDDGDTVGDAIGDHDPGFARVESGITLERLASSLPERQREILTLRFAADMTQQEIADRVGISQMHVSRLLRQALERMAALAEDRTAA